MKKLNQYLVLFYVLWQTGHLLVNGYGFFRNKEYLVSFLGGSMNRLEFQALLLSGWIDLFFVSPLGIIAAWLFLKANITLFLFY